MELINQTAQRVKNRITQTQTAQPPPASNSASVTLKPPCPNCDGQRHIRYDVEIDDPAFGRSFPCPVCNGDAVTYNSGLNPQERKITLDYLEIAGRPGAKAMKAAAHKFIETGCKGFLTVHGDYGNGKSTAMKAMVNECLRRELEARYITMTEVMVYAKEAFDSQQQGDSDYGRIAKLAQVRVLFIDELDKARITDYAREVQTHLFDVRYRNAGRFGTVVAWNGPYDAIGLPWVLSRLSEYTVIENKDPDMRPLLGGKS